MPFQIPCTNPKCGKLQSPYLDKKTDKVYCELCDQEITNVTHFAKVQMKALKQYKEKKKTPFSVKCVKCNKEELPIIAKNDDIICGACKSPLDQLSPIYKNMLRTQLRKVGQDI